MSPEEIVYLEILAGSILVGFLFRYLSEYFGSLKRSTKNKNMISCDCPILTCSVFYGEC